MPQHSIPHHTMHTITLYTIAYKTLLYIHHCIQKPQFILTYIPIGLYAQLEYIPMQSFLGYYSVASFLCLYSYMIECTETEYIPMLLFRRTIFLLVGRVGYGILSYAIIPMNRNLFLLYGVHQEYGHTVGFWSHLPRVGGSLHQGRYDLYSIHIKVYRIRYPILKNKKILKKQGTRIYNLKQVPY